jgi:hypothetical protein
MNASGAQRLRSTSANENDRAALASDSGRHLAYMIAKSESSTEGGNVMGLEAVVSRLQYDWNFVADFLNDADAALGSFQLNPAEAAALKARDARALSALGLDESAVSVALSGAHSSTCPM